MLSLPWKAWGSSTACPSILPTIVFTCRAAEGFVSVYKQRDSDHYESLGRITTTPIARTSLFVPELNRLYVAIPKQDDRDAQIRVYEPVP